MSLNDKIAIVTGGSRGLGLGLVEALVACTAQGDDRTRGGGARRFLPGPAGRRHDLDRCHGRDQLN